MAVTQIIATFSFLFTFRKYNVAKVLRWLLDEVPLPAVVFDLYY